MLALALLHLGCAKIGSATSLPDTASGDCWQALTLPTLSADPANSRWDAPSVSGGCTADSFIVESNGIPSYEYVDMTPNGLQEQDHVYEVPLEPRMLSSPQDIPLLGQVGFAVNGMPLFGPNEAQFPDPYGDPVYNSIVDRCLGHTAQQGLYHYHALVVACVRADLDVGEDEPDPVIGFAGDGLPIYGPRGCADAACSEVVEYESSWQQTGDPSTYAWDNHVYQERGGDQYLDRCNGHTGPDGDYHYHATASFPYILGCYAAEPAAGF
ncbi:MAG: YHYH protein [Alphaproteobacteria bacterium]|nr:YHYH protein [Alphaproteobacteria bacterium]